MTASPVSTGRSFDPRKRQRARRLLLQALYQWQMTHVDVDVLIAEFLASDEIRGSDTNYFIVCLRAIIAGSGHLDAALEKHLDRPPQQVDPVARAALRIAAHEMLQRTDIPHRVAIDEAVNLTHVFGAEPAHKYVNAVLDGLARHLRGEAPRPLSEASATRSARAPKAAPGTMDDDVEAARTTDAPPLAAPAAASVRRPTLRRTRSCASVNAGAVAIPTTAPTAIAATDATSDATSDATATPDPAADDARCDG